MVIAESRKQFGKERAGVEDKINTWHHQIFDEKKLAYEEQKAAKIAAGELPPEAAGKHTPVVEAVAKRPEGDGQKNQTTTSRSDSKSKRPDKHQGKKPFEKRTGDSRPHQPSKPTQRNNENNRAEKSFEKPQQKVLKN